MSQSISGFDYFQDAGTGGTHRAAEQVRNIPINKTTYIIHLSGAYDDGTGNGVRHNAFAKKHLITFKYGGTHQAGLASGDGKLTGPRVKAESILLKRFNHATLNQYNVERQAKQNALAPQNQALLPVQALGGAVTRRNTVVICDYIDPDEIWQAFARGLDEKKPWSAGARKSIRVEFNLRKTSKDYCIITSKYGGQPEPAGTEMHVLAHCTAATKGTVECHIVHFEGVE